MIIKAINLILIVLSMEFLNLNYNPPPIEIPMQETAINVNDNLLDIFNLGNKRFFVSLLWIKTLMDSDTEHYKNNNLNNWMYLRFNSILKLDPKFLEAYQYGGQYLAIIKDDIMAAENIYSRGLKYYPDDYFLNFNAAFNYLYEMNEPQRALPLFERIKDYPQAPHYLPSIISKLYIHENNIEEAYALLLDIYNKTDDSNIFMKKKLKDDLYAIKAMIDLDCLNKGKSDCEKRDFNGNIYLRNFNNKYYAQEEWVKPKLYMNKP